MANDPFTGALADLTTPWAYSSPSSSMNIERDGSGNARSKSNWVAHGVYHTTGDDAECEILMNNGAASSSGAYFSPRVLCGASQAGYEARFSENGTNYNAGSFRRNGSWIGTMSFTAQGDATGDCWLGITWEDEGGDSRLRAWIDGTEVATLLDTSASKLTSGDGPGFILYGAGNASTAAITEWRDIIGGGGGGPTDVYKSTLHNIHSGARTVRGGGLNGIIEARHRFKRRDRIFVPERFAA